VPSLRRRRHALVGETGELVADQGVGFVQAGVAKAAGAAPLAQDMGDLLAHGDGVAAGHELTRRRRVQGRRLIETEVAGTGKLVLAHGDAVAQLFEIGAESALQDQPLQVAQPAGGVQPLRPTEQLRQRGHVGRHPSVTMQRILMGGEAIGFDRPAGRRQAHRRDVQRV
jgi:hypothetical protein